MPASAVSIRIVPRLSAIAGALHNFFFFPFFSDFCSGGVFMVSA